VLSEFRFFAPETYQDAEPRASPMSATATASHEALQLLVEMLDDDGGDGRGGLLRAGACLDQQESLAVGRDVVFPPGTAT
jgi:hypothetical protein